MTTELLFKESHIVAVGLFARLKFKPGTEEELTSFLLEGLEMAEQEPTTLVWFALRIDRT